MMPPVAPPSRPALPQTPVPGAKRESQEPAKKGNAFVVLGRAGDLINLFPLFRLRAEASGNPINLVASLEFESLFEGTAYINPDLLDIPADKISVAKAYAAKKYSQIVPVQVWGDGQRQSSKTRAYNMDAWSMAGELRRFTDRTLVPIFDSRNMAREFALYDRIVSGNKPLMLIQIEGGYSSPCGNAAQIKRPILDACSRDYQIVDLNQVRAVAIQDMLGLMEAASVMVLSDTAPLHLAAATATPVIALLSDRGQWNMTAPRCHTVWSGTYKTAPVQMAQIISVIRGVQKKEPAKTPPILIHAVEAHAEGQNENRRNSIARKSWYEWYKSKRVVTSILREPYSRDGRSVGDNRPIPFIKDVFRKALQSARPEDVIVWSNSDSILVSPAITTAITAAIAKTPVTTMRRLDASTKKPAPGRDLYAVRASFLADHWTEMPDFLLGAAEFDNWMALYARWICGIKSSARDLFEDRYPCDMPPGAMLHIDHESTALTGDFRYTSLQNLYNLALLRDWCRLHQPRVKFMANGHVDWNV